MNDDMTARLITMAALLTFLFTLLVSLVGIASSVKADDGGFVCEMTDFWVSDNHPTKVAAIYTCRETVNREWMEQDVLVLRDVATGLQASGLWGAPRFGKVEELPA